MTKRQAPAPLAPAGEYADLLGGVASLLDEARLAAGRSVNAILTVTYWEIGRRIVEFEQRGEIRAGYGRELLRRLAKDLTARHGRGFGYSNLNLIRPFYLAYRERRPILQPVIGELVAGPGGQPQPHGPQGFPLS